MPGGDCYEAAFHALMHQPTDAKDAVLVHGVVVNTGEAEGERMGHAWVEVTQMVDGFPFVVVHDHSNGNDAVIPKAFYYAVGNINEDECVKYSWHAARSYAAEKEHYGPWHEMSEDVL